MAIRPDAVEVRVSISRLVVAMGLDPKRLEKTIRQKLAEVLHDD